MEKKPTQEIYFPTQQEWLQFVNRNRNYLKLDNQVLATYNAQLANRLNDVSEKYRQQLTENVELLKKHTVLVETYHASLTQKYLSTKQTLQVIINKN